MKILLNIKSKYKQIKIKVLEVIAEKVQKNYELLNEILNWINKTRIRWKRLQKYWKPKYFYDSRLKNHKKPK